MVILGITDGQTSGAAVIVDGAIVAAINEERLVRLKQARGFPRASIKAVLKIAGIEPTRIDAVGIAQVDMKLNEEIKEWKGWFEERGDIRDTHNLFFNFASKFSKVANSIPVLKSLYYLLRRPINIKRRKRIREILSNEFSINAPVSFHDHHYTHAASAYFTSGYKDGLVVTMDGGGDRNSSHVYLGKDGRLELLSKVDSYDSLGNYYAYVTAICGFKAKKHEGKITGLAARGKPVYYDSINSLISCSKGRMVNTGGVLFNSAIEKIKNVIGENFSRDDLASSIQKLSENLCRDYVKYWMEKTKMTKLALAGGVFANVRINQEVFELEEVEDIFIHPGMSDEGLAVGAALASWAESMSASGAFPQAPVINDAYLGFEFDDSEIESAIKDAGYKHRRFEEIEKEIASLLAEGYVVARFNGRMEYGPRALGNRSILYHPSDSNVNDWLNKNLVRTEFMPFAPSVLYEKAEQCFVNFKGAEDAARFMTVTFNCTEWMREHCAGVVHIDNTARPQLVRNTDNPSYHNIIKAFDDLTGVPVIINTSFNMHEEPIVCTPYDALRAFKLGHLDYLAIGNYLVKNKYEITRKLVRMKVRQKQDL